MEPDEVRDLVEDLLAYQGDVQVLEDWLVSNGVSKGPAHSLCKTLEHAVNSYNQIKG